MWTKPLQWSTANWRQVIEESLEQRSCKEKKKEFQDTIQREEIEVKRETEAWNNWANEVMKVATQRALKESECVKTSQPNQDSKRQPNAIAQSTTSSRQSLRFSTVRRGYTLLLNGLVDVRKID